MIIEYDNDKECTYIMNKMVDMSKNKILFTIKPSKEFIERLKK